MNIKIFSFPVFSFQFSLNNTDGVATNRRTPITIISIDKIINTFIIFKLYHKFLGTLAGAIKNDFLSFGCIEMLIDCR